MWRGELTAQTEVEGLAPITPLFLEAQALAPAPHLRYVEAFL